LGELREFRIPNLRLMLKQRERWKPRPAPGETPRIDSSVQHVVPADAELHEKMGLRPGAKVLFFAGGAGDWADALAERGVEVHYADASAEMTKYAKERFRRTKIRSFTTMDAVRWPEKTGPEKTAYARLVSFEPFPVMRSSLPVAALRAIAHSTGMTLAYVLDSAATSQMEFPPLNAMIRGLKALYGAQSRVDETRVGASSLRGYPASSPLSVPLSVYHIDAPPAGGRKLAQLDLAVLSALAYKKKASVAELAAHPSVAQHKPSGNELLDSLKRLDTFSQLVSPEFVKKVKVTTA